MSELDKSYWENRYKSGQTEWDIGNISRPLKTYIDSIEELSMKILIPGSGLSWEAEYLWNKGFKQVYVLDISNEALTKFRNRFQDFPVDHCIQSDYFEHHAQYDLIIEQTFFCALPTVLRDKYVNHSRKLLYPNGKLVGLFFNKEFETSGPPFGGTRQEYIDLFENKFIIQSIEDCHNSIDPRKGNELFIQLRK